MICPACNSKYEDSLAFCPKDGTTLIPDDARQQSRVGTILADRYRIVRLLGEGGMGEVYEAEHIYIKKTVALKLLRSEITSNQEAVTRFHQEALAASTIGHENIVNIDDFGRLADGSVYLTMEYLHGSALSDLMLKGRMSSDRALDLIGQICAGLSAAHSKGIIHRDMKPENVYVVEDRDGRELAKILDFGIAKVSSADTGQNLTKTGTIFGTPHYMSPEQAMGRGLDHRTDIYSVGVIMYELFTGTVPFKAESFMGILTQHITALPQAPRECAPDRDIHPEIERIILRAMDKEPAKRYPSMVEFLEDLKNVRRTVTGMQAAVPLATMGRPVIDVKGAGGAGWAAPATSAHPVAARTSDPMMAPMAASPAAHVSAGPLAVAAPKIGKAKRRKGGGGKVAALIGVLLLVLGGGGAAAWYFLVYAKQGEESSKKTDSEEKVADQGAPDAAAPLPDMDAMDAMQTDPMTEAMALVGLGPVDGMQGGDRAAAPVSVAVQSEPSGADVQRDGKVLCATPCNVDVPAGGELDVILVKDGYADKPMHLRADGPKTVRGELTKQEEAMRPAGMRVEPRTRPVGMERERPREMTPPREMDPPREMTPPRRRATDPFGEGLD